MIYCTTICSTFYLCYNLSILMRKEELYEKKLSIVVPCYNEEESLPLFYKAVDKITDR